MSRGTTQVFGSSRQQFPEFWLQNLLPQIIAPFETVPPIYTPTGLPHPRGDLFCYQ